MSNGKCTVMIKDNPPGSHIKYFLYLDCPIQDVVEKIKDTFPKSQLLRSGFYVKFFRGWDEKGDYISLNLPRKELYIDVAICILNNFTVDHTLTRIWDTAL